MPAEKMTIALLEAHYGVEQDQDREEANGALFLDSSTGERKGVQSALEGTPYV